MMRVQARASKNVSALKIVLRVGTMRTCGKCEDDMYSGVVSIGCCELTSCGSPEMVALGVLSQLSSVASLALCVVASLASCNAQRVFQLLERQLDPTGPQSTCMGVIDVNPAAGAMAATALPIQQPVTAIPTASNAIPAAIPDPEGL